MTAHTSDRTHAVRHKNGYEVAIYIAPSHIDKLHSHDTAVRSGAQRAICLRFREECTRQYPGVKLNWVSWGDIEVTELHHAIHVPRSADDLQECDDCPSCDIGHHERCYTRRCAQAY